VTDHIDASPYGPSVESIVRDQRIALSFSTQVSGYQGVDVVCLRVPAALGLSRRPRRMAE